jgi:hypothetical protein
MEKVKELIEKNVISEQDIIDYLNSSHYNVENLWEE